MVEDLGDGISLTVEPPVVAVAGKGGVGKTTLSATLMRCLSERGLRVLAVDADPTALLGTYLGVTVRSTVGQVAEGARKAVRSGVVARPRDLVEQEIKRSLLHTPHGDLLTMGAPGGKGCYCAANSAVRATLEEIVRAATEGAPAGQYDIVLVDCEPGLEIFSRGTLDRVGELVVVAEPTAAGLLVAAQIWQTANELVLAPIGGPGWMRPVLLNKVHGAPEAISGDGMPAHIVHLLTEYQLQVRWKVPYDQSAAEGGECGQPVSTVSASSAFMGAVDKLAGDLSTGSRRPCVASPEGTSCT